MLAFDTVSVGGNLGVPLTLEESGSWPTACPAPLPRWKPGVEGTVTTARRAGNAVLWETGAELGETKAWLRACLTEDGPMLFFECTRPGRGLTAMPFSREESRFMAHSLPGAMDALDRWLARRKPSGKPSGNGSPSIPGPRRRWAQPGHGPGGAST